MNVWEDSTQGYNPTVGSGMLFHSVYLTLMAKISLATVVDSVENVKGMYRLLDLLGESGSNGYGKSIFLRTKPFKQQRGLQIS